MLTPLYLTTYPAHSAFSGLTFLPYFTRNRVTGESKLTKCYIDGEAESIAGFDIPFMVNGDVGQLDLPEDQQQIFLMLPDREPIKLVSRIHYCSWDGTPDAYYLQLPEEELSEADYWDGDDAEKGQ